MYVYPKSNEGFVSERLDNADHPTDAYHQDKIKRHYRHQSAEETQQISWEDGEFYICSVVH